jgi:hypothetical protein
MISKEAQRKHFQGLADSNYEAFQQAKALKKHVAANGFLAAHKDCLSALEKIG